jgi:hypothetical protein
MGVKAASWSASLALVVLASTAVPSAIPGQTRFVYNRGQSVSPAYEGWMTNADGSFTLYFGYMNPNWQEELDVSVGPDNNIQPGGPDQGQPTHFYPRRNPFLFTIRVPRDFGNQELVWTLTTHGKTEKTYASLKTDYAIDNQIISTEVGGDMGSTEDKLRNNIPPELEIDGAAQRTVNVGEPLTLVALAGDPDDYPLRRDGKPQPRHPGEAIDKAQKAASPSAESRTEAEDPARLVFTPPSEGVPSNPPGLRLSWIVYRGRAGSASFSPDQMETWEDDRPWANSPWAFPFVIPEPPADGKWVTKVTFSEPGTYVLRAVASDSAVFTYQNVTVTVTR